MDLLKIINTATNAIPTFSGRDDEARAMLAALEMLKESVDEQHHRIIVQAVESKLKGKGRKIIGTTVNRVDEIINKIKTHLKKTESPEDIASAIHASKQKTTPKDFGEEIQTLAEELERAYLNEKMDPELASEKIKKIAMTAFGKGLKKELHLGLVLSGTIPSLEAAIKAIDIMDKLSQNSQERKRKKIQQLFHIVPDNFKIPADGILGRDFFYGSPMYNKL